VILIEQRRPGRPQISKIRERLCEILSCIDKASGYDLHKIYVEVYGKVTIRSIYYNLHTGVLIGYFNIESIKQEQGEFSWGTEVEKKYYSIHPKGRKTMKTELKERIVSVARERLKKQNNNIN
jgi:DNA-binding PadR family transcriptional regulator